MVRSKLRLFQPASAASDSCRWKFTGFPVIFPAMRAAIFLALTFSTPALRAADAPSPAAAPIPPAPTAVAAPAPTSSILPTPFPASRYAQLREKSPFALATAPEIAKPPERTFAEGWKIKGITQLPGGLKTTDMVCIKTAENQSITLETDKETSDGVSLVRVEYSPDMGKSIAWVKKGTEQAKIEFDQTDMMGTPAVAPAAAGQRPPNGVPPVFNNMGAPRQPGAPHQGGTMGGNPGGKVVLPVVPRTSPTPFQPGGGIPRPPVNNGVIQPVPVQGGVGFNPAANGIQQQDSRRRVRVINSPPQ